MSKPFKSWDIVNFLDNKKNSINSAVRTLGISKTSITKVMNAWDSLTEKPELSNLTNETLNELLFKKKENYCDDYIKECLKYLEKENVSFDDAYEYVKTKTTISKSNLYRQIRIYCKKHDLSDRKKFKPGAITEIGWIEGEEIKDDEKKDSSSEECKQELSDTPEFLKTLKIFYIYLPFSRYVNFTVTHAKDQLLMCNELANFFLKIGGITDKINFKDSYNKMFRHVTDNYFFHRFSKNINVSYETHTQLCVFRTMESDLLESIKAIKAPKKIGIAQLQQKIDILANQHNYNIARIPLTEEKKKLRSAENIEKELDTDERIVSPETLHLRYNKNYYSCPYQHYKLYCNPVTIAITPKKILIYDSPERNILLSIHNLLPANTKHLYSTNANDLPENDEQRRSAGIKTIEEYLKDAEEFGTATKELCRKYIEYTTLKKGHPEYALKLIKCFLDSHIIEEKIPQEILSLNDDSIIPRALYFFIYGKKGEYNRFIDNQMEKQLKKTETNNEIQKNLQLDTTYHTANNPDDDNLVYFSNKGYEYDSSEYENTQGEIEENKAPLNYSSNVGPEAFEDSDIPF